MSIILLWAGTHSSGGGGDSKGAHLFGTPHDEGFGAGGVRPPPTTKDLELGGVDPPPTTKDLELGGSDPPPHDEGFGAGGG